MSDPEPPNPGPPNPDPTDDDLDGGAVALAVRATLAAVAERTTIAERPLRSVAQPTAADHDHDDEPGIVLATGDEDERRPAASGRRWPLLAAAAALVVVLVGLVALANDHRTVTTAPAGEAPPPSAEPAPGPITEPTTAPPGSTVPAGTARPSTGAWDTACAMWAGIEAHLATTGDRFDPGSGEDLLGLQAAAPPELRPDVDQLLRLAMVEPPPPAYEESLVRIRVTMLHRCGTGT